MAHRVHQGRAKPIGPAQGFGLQRLGRQLRALQRHRALLKQGQDQALVVRATGHRPSLDPGDAGPGANAVQRPEGPARLRQGAGSETRGLAALPGPAGGSHGRRVERLKIRRTRNGDDLAITGQQHHGPRPGGGRHLFGKGLGDSVPSRSGRECAAGGQQGRDRRRPPLRAQGLVPDPSGQSTRRQGHSPEDDQRQEVGRRSHHQAVARFKEQIVVDEKGDGRGGQGGPQALQHPGGQHGGQEDHAQIDPVESHVEPPRRQGGRPDEQGAGQIGSPGAFPGGFDAPGLALLTGLGNDMDRLAPRLAQQGGRQRPAHQLAPATVGRLADDDLGDVVAPGVGHHQADDIAAGQRDGRRTQLLGQLESVAKARPGPLACRRLIGALDMGDGPGRIHHHVRQAPAGPDQAAGHGVAAHQHKDPLARRPGPLDALLAHRRDQLVVDRLGGAAQGQLAQGREVFDLEEVL